MGLVYLDTNVFIQAFESAISIAQPVRDLLARLTETPGAAVTSELTLAELLAPTRIKGGLTVAEKASLYQAVFDQGWIDFVPVSRAVLVGTATLRQHIRHKLPDAIHIVTALQSGCSFLVSHDMDAKRLPPSIVHVVPTEAGIALIVEALHD